MPSKHYVRMGLGLLVAGSVVFVMASVIFNVAWLAALGVSLLVLGLICLVLGRSLPTVSPRASALFLETGMDNIDSILEELGLRTKCVYLPGSLAGGKPKALIPLHTNPVFPRVVDALPKRLIARYGTRPDDVGLLVSTLGTGAIGLLETKPGNSAGEVETALTRLFRGIMDVADGASVFYQGNHVRVEVLRPRLRDRPGWSHDSLGGALTSVVATVLAEAWQKPVTVLQEEPHEDRTIIELEVLT